MADITTNTAFTQRPNIVANFVMTAWNFLVSISEQNQRVRRLEELASLSDDQLARLGLERVDIVHEVFRDKI